jgi:AAA domain
MADEHNALTAIRDSASEGFVASTLYSQGWNINFRALDFDSLIAHIRLHDCKKSILLISTDCEGFKEESLEELRELVQKVIIVFTSPESSSHSDAISLPTTALELISLMRGSLRSPMIRAPQALTKRPNAKIVAIGGISGGLGCTTFAINLAVELASKNKRVLLVDAHPHLPSISRLLEQRGLNAHGEFRKISQHLWASEITENNILLDIEGLDRAADEFDFIVCDLGVINDFAAQLSGRRWSGQALIWVSTYADSLMMLAPSDRVGLERLQFLTTQMATNAIKPSLTFIHVHRQQGRREQERSAHFLKVVTPLRPYKICEYPYDPRSVLKAELEESSLIDSNERGIVRRMIASIAGELVS